PLEPHPIATRAGRRRTFSAPRARERRWSPAGDPGVGPGARRTWTSVLARSVLDRLARLLAVLLVAEHPAAADVLGLDAQQVALGEPSRRVDDAAGLAQAGALESVAHAAAVGEAGLLHAPLEVVVERRLGFLRELVPLLVEHEEGDLHQLIQLVVG